VLDVKVVVPSANQFDQLVCGTGSRRIVLVIGR
jgi:hypothetical protein